MADLEVHDEVVPLSGGRNAGGAGRAPRHVVSESVAIGERDARPDNGGRGEDDSVTVGAGRGRKLSDSAKRMLANIDKHGVVSDDAPTTTVDEPTEGEAKPDAPEKAETPAEETKEAPPEQPKPDPAPHEAALTEARTTNERLSTRNRELLAEVERLSKGSSRSVPSAREKALLEAWRIYPEDPAAGLRTFLAAVHDAEDPKAKEIDEELSSVYQDLTARELNVSLDETQKARQEAARTRLLLARDKRERKAEIDAASKPKDDPEAQQTAEMTQVIGNRLSSKNSDGKSLADRFPLLTSLAEDFDGAKPEAALWNEIKRGVRSGQYDPSTPDERLLEMAASNIETRYQARADKIVAARKPASTAQPTLAAPEKANNETGQSHGTRTITTRDASVAPATPPAKKTEQQVTTKPTYKTEKERRAALARKHAGEN